MNIYHWLNSRYGQIIIMAENLDEARSRILHGAKIQALAYTVKHFKLDGTESNEQFEQFINKLEFDLREDPKIYPSNSVIFI